MLPLARTDQTEALVLSNDPAVQLPKGDRVPVRAIPLRDAKVRGTATVVYARPLSGAERLRVWGGSDNWGVNQTEGAMLSVEKIQHGPDPVKDVTQTPEETVAYLERLPAAAIMAVARWCYHESALPDDPLGPSESAPSSGSTSSSTSPAPERE